MRSCLSLAEAEEILDSKSSKSGNLLSSLAQKALLFELSGHQSWIRWVLDFARVASSHLLIGSSFGSRSLSQRSGATRLALLGHSGAIKADSFSGIGFLVPKMSQKRSLEIYFRHGKSS